MRNASNLRETARLTRHPALDGLEMLAATYRDHAYALHTHPTWVFGVVTAGVERFRVGRTDNLAAPGSILVVNPEEPHDGEKGCEAGWSYRTCYPSPGLMREVADELELADLPMFSSAVLPAPDLARSFLVAHAGAGAEGAVESEAAMLVALAAIVRRFGDGRAQDTGAGPAGSAGRLALYDDLVTADLAVPLRLSALAAAAGVTRFQVIRDFKRTVGTTPGRYVRDRRVRRACDLIGEGLPLAAVAAETGFADQSHMTRAFKTVKGVTPAAYRAATAG
ncbi:MAG: AraC family transcriptional regulator [Thalassobaculum sp.]|uniref:AraC family transcriptional regulator n=1 Tax=Thalassobaculum sp. TaxID=2022740 RepID=UPI0032EB4105